MKKRFVILLLAIFALTATASAQSGRRINKTPTQPVVIEEKSERLEPEYSESSPSKGRPIYPSQTPRAPKTKPETNSKKQTKDQNKKQTPNQPAATEPATDDDGDVLRVETNLITIPVSVYDRNGLYIPSLQQADFKIFEDGEEQEIAYFATSEKPFTVILLLDTSPSTEYRIDEIQQAAIAFVNQLKMQDSVMVVEFDENIHVLTEATNDRQRIFKAIQRADFGGGTSLYDAVDFSLRKRLSKIEGRKAIVLFTDGVDTTSSKAFYESTIQQAEESEAMVFPIYYNTFLDNRRSGGVMSNPSSWGLPGGMSSVGTRAEDYARGRAYLAELAGVTGGRVFRPESTPGGLTAAFEGIAEELRRQYNIGYYPKNEGKAGQRKQIRVRVNRPNLAIRARDSYIVGGNTQAANTK